MGVKLILLEARTRFAISTSGTYSRGGRLDLNLIGVRESETPDRAFIGKGAFVGLVPFGYDSVVRKRATINTVRQGILGSKSIAAQRVATFPNVN